MHRQREAVKHLSEFHMYIQCTLILPTPLHSLLTPWICPLSFMTPPFFKNNASSPINPAAFSRVCISQHGQLNSTLFSPAAMRRFLFFVRHQHYYIQELNVWKVSHAGQVKYREKRDYSSWASGFNVWKGQRPVQSLPLKVWWESQVEDLLTVGPTSHTTLWTSLSSTVKWRQLPTQGCSVLK